MTRHLSAVLVALTSIGLTGCPTEVPYEPPTSEAPEFEPSVANEAVQGETPSEEPIAAAPAPNDRTPADDGSGPKRFPWESDAPGDAPSEAKQLFAGVEATPSENETDPADQATEDQADAEPADDFEDFLGNAYAGLLEESATTEAAVPSETTPTPEAESALGSEPVAGGAAPPPTPQVESPSETSIGMDDFLKAAVEAPTRSATPGSAKAPTTVEPADSDLLAELWGDEEPTDAAARTSSEPPPEPYEPSGLPFGDPEPVMVDAEPEVRSAEDEPAGLPFGEADSLFAEEPPAESPPPVEPEPLPEPPEPTPTFATDEPALPFEDPPAAPPTVSTTPPLAASAIQPLPAVPVLTYNTRHLAWLLGGKLGLAELADLDGATATELATWSDEVRRLTRELEVADPGSARATTRTPAERVRRVMTSAASLGADLASEHGSDHAALLEIAFKSNALLVIAEQRPDLAAPVGEAIRGAADRAMLPRFLWEDTVKTLGREPTAEEALDAVVRLHERVESFLR